MDSFHERHVGEMEIRLDFEKVRGCVPAGTDPAKFLAALQADLSAALGKHFTDHELIWGDEFAKFEYGWEEPEIIKTRKEAAADWEAARESMAQCFTDADERRAEQLAADPNNGKQGYWRVEGVRHEAIVQASSATEAVGKAVVAQAVGDWESPTAMFIGEEMPEVC